MIQPHELIVDNFAGGGGASLGIEMALGRSPDIAINHDAEAIALHKANHPNTRHYCEDVWKVDPVTVCAGRPVGLMWLSPDCKHFSKAKGGKPVSKKIRGLAWVAVRWAAAVKPRVIWLENVEEFQDWGPVLASGKPCPARKGLTFRRFIAKLRRLGYEVQYKELRGCDYGAPTIRKRLFLGARCDGEPIVWPAPTHGMGRPLPWRTAAECIDWSLPCPSIFLTKQQAKALGLRIKRPLAEATMRRIANGLKRFVLDNPHPFIIPVTHQGDTRSHPITEPFRTITGAHRGEHALVAPYVTKYHGESAGASVEDPLATVTANSFQKRSGGSAPLGVVVPYLARTAHGEQDASGKKRGKGEHAIEAPIPTVLASPDYAIVAPTLIQTGYGEREGQAPRAPGLEKPLGTVVAGGQKHALVAGFLAKHYGGHYDGPGATLEGPVHTVTADDHHALVASSLVKFKGTAKHGQQLTLPLHTVQASGQHYGEVRAFLFKYYGTEQKPDLALPLHTVTAKDRFGLVTVHGELYAIADIGMRMLAPRELYRAQGFPDSYVIDIPFDGKPMTVEAKVRMCGNSVCPPLAAALVRANYIHSLPFTPAEVAVA